MKKTIIILLLLCTCSIPIFSMDFMEDIPGFQEGALSVSTSCGWGMSRTYGNLTFPPLYVTGSYNFLIADILPVSFGGFWGTMSSAEVFNYGANANDIAYNYNLLGLRLAWHFGEHFELRNFDLYAGLSMGGGFIGSTITGPDKDILTTDPDVFIVGGFGGVRYFFNRYLGIFLEGGWGPVIISGGISLQYPPGGLSAIFEDEASQESSL